MSRIAGMALVLAGAIAADARADHRGHVIGGGHVGVAQQALHSDQAGERRRTAFSPALFAGYGADRYVLFGVEIDGWPIEEWSDAAASEELVTAMSFVRFAPQRHHGLYLLGAAGYAHYSDSENSARDGHGFAWAAGAGYELQLNEDYSLLPQIAYSRGRLSDSAIESDRHYEAIEFSIGIQAYLSPGH